MVLFMDRCTYLKKAAYDILDYFIKPRPKHLTEEVIYSTERKMHFPNVVLFLTSVFVIVLAAPGPVSVHLPLPHIWSLFIPLLEPGSSRTLCAYLKSCSEYLGFWSSVKAPLQGLLSHNIEQTTGSRVEMRQVYNPDWGRRVNPEPEGQAGLLLWITLLDSEGLVASFFKLYYLKAHSSFHILDILGFAEDK